jgi:hypothetical protein
MTAIIFDKYDISQCIMLIHNTVLDLTGDRINDAEKIRMAENTLRNIRGRIEGQGITL